MRPRGGRLVRQGRDVAPVYLRRLGILFALGVAHNLLVWNGDVMHIYAILGLLLLALGRKEGEAKGWRLDRVLALSISVIPFVLSLPLWTAFTGRVAARMR